MASFPTNLHVVGTGRYVPPHKLTNADLEKMVETSDEWIVSHTGIHTRHIAKEEKTSDMATKAALQALAKSNYDKNLIDVIIVATITGETTTPSMANLVQAKLDLNHRPIMCFDVNAACTGFIYALDVASALLDSKRYHSALVIGVESLSKIMDYSDRNTCILFGDGAGAMIVTRGSAQEGAYFFSASEGDIEDTLTVCKTLTMKGPKVYRFAVNIVESCIRKTLQETKLTFEEIAKIIPHQANLRILASVAESLQVSLDKFFINLSKYGNTSAASIPLAIDEYLEQSPRQKGQRLLCVGFGGGLTWGTALITL